MTEKEIRLMGRTTIEAYVDEMVSKTEDFILGVIGEYLTEYGYHKKIEINGANIKAMAEKQIPKKPKYLPLKEGITTTNYECPICGCRRLGHGFNLDKCYCPECGQKLDWRDLE